MKNIKEALRKGEVVWGGSVFSSSPVMVEIWGYLGYDWIWIDSEHSSQGPYGNDMVNLIRAAYAADITPLCRVVENDAAQIKKVLDFGAKGIIAPLIKNREDAQKLVDSCLFPPKGNRGACPEVRAFKYGTMSDWPHHMGKSNNEILIIPLIEQKEAIENLEDILSVEGITAIFVGPIDLAIDLGIVNEKDKSNSNVSDFVKIYMTDPKILKQMERIYRICKDRNVPILSLARNPEMALELIQKGVRMIGFPCDTTMFRSMAKEFIEKARIGLKSLNLK
jgi:4-hydroxy-2-oxoheptanedioate aldolase